MVKETQPERPSAPVAHPHEHPHPDQSAVARQRADTMRRRPGWYGSVPSGASAPTALRAATGGTFPDGNRSAASSATLAAAGATAEEPSGRMAAPGV